ncbi:hypothetical protein A7M40_19175 [Acinetobacter baumannii]|nr:hypothetical protein A7M40_19175 [Acinetobacter baumannii]
MERNIISVKWWSFTETFSVDFLEDPEKLRPAALFHFPTFTDIKQLINHHYYTFKPEETLNRQNKTNHTTSLLAFPPKSP